MLALAWLLLEQYQSFIRLLCYFTEEGSPLALYCNDVDNIIKEMASKIFNANRDSLYFNRIGSGSGRTCVLCNVFDCFKWSFKIYKKTIH